MINIGVLDDYDGSISRMSCWKRLPSSFKIIFFDGKPDATELEQQEVLVAVRERTKIDAEFLHQCLNLKHLALTGRLSGQADLDCLKSRDIAVSYTDGSGPAAAEITMALIFSLAKGIHTRHQNVCSGGWQNGLSESLVGKTLGILGMGRVGSMVAQLGILLKMNVVSWGPTEKKADHPHVARLPLRDVLSASDIVSINLRHSPLTQGLLGAKELACMRDGAMLVNTARAEIVDRAALYAELGSGRISGAFDVFHTEPLPSDDPIRGFPNVLLSPHMGYVTRQVYDTFFEQVVDNIIQWSEGKPYRNALQEV